MAQINSPLSIILKNENASCHMVPHAAKNAFHIANLFTIRAAKNREAT